MKPNCGLIKNLRTKIFGEDEYFICPSNQDCPHDKKREVVKNRKPSQICNLDPYWRVSIMYSQKPIRNEEDVDNFFNTVGDYFRKDKIEEISGVLYMEIEENLAKRIKDDSEYSEKRELPKLSESPPL